MSRFFKAVIPALTLMLSAPGTLAFSLLGPFTSWQVQGLSYQLGGDIGGPMNVREGFRWNVPVITYAYDKSFVDYFGPDGIAAVDQAIRHFNDLPAAAKISSDLSEYSPQTLRENFEAETLGVFDLKSTAMRLLIEELGFADPIRWTFSLRARTTETIAGTTYTNYTTILRNFDPVTLAPSRYVNGTLYTYQILEFTAPNRADAVEVVQFDADGIPDIPVARGITGAIGIFNAGLTRDDVGGIRFLYHPNNYAVETLLPTITIGAGLGGSAAWIPFLTVTNAGTNTIVTTNLVGTNIVSAGLRGGRNKLKFQRVFFDGILGQAFTAVTNAYTDVTLGSNSTVVVQPVLRGIVQPDIVFVVEDIGLLADNLTPALSSRTTTANWIDNDAINGNDDVTLSRGPGVIAPPVRISFTDQLPFFQNLGLNEFLAEFPSEASSFNFGVWGSFDGSTNPPVIYPVYQNITIPQLRKQILNGGSGQ